MNATETANWNKAKLLIANGITLCELATDKSQVGAVVLEYFKEAADLLDALSFHYYEYIKKDKGVCFARLGFCFLNMGMYEIAIDFSQQALAMLAAFPDTPFEKGQCHETLAAAYGHLGRH